MPRLRHTLKNSAPTLFSGRFTRKRFCPTWHLLGAGELSYWLELKPLFEYYRVNYPVQVLRPMAGIVSNGLIRKLEKLNLKVEDFFGDVEQLINRYVQSNLSVNGALDNEKEKLSVIFDAIANKAAQQDPTLKQNVAGRKAKSAESR